MSVSVVHITSDKLVIWRIKTKSEDYRTDEINVSLVLS